MSLWLLVALAVAVVLISVLWLRLHAFLALLLAGVLVALLTPEAALEQYAESQIALGRMDSEEAAELLATPPPQRLAAAFGSTAASVGILIALASVIGGCLLESGAAAVLIHRTLAIVGARRAPVALVGSSFVLGIPVFFDTVFFLMVPLAKQLRRQLGRDYVLFILCILAGGSIAHSLVPPTPGPLQVAELIGVDLLTLIFAGLAVGVCSTFISVPFAWWINRRVDVPLRDESVTEQGPGLADGPPLSLALLTILLPVVLIAGSTFFRVAEPQVAGAVGDAATERIAEVLEVFGDKNVALGIAASLALVLLWWAPQRHDRRSVVGKALASGGVIILITAAGGAFGAMLRQAGISAAFSDIGGSLPPLALLPVAFLLTTAIRTLQGSSTVAMITAAGVLQGFADAVPYDPVYLALAIGAGSKPISWMTDSGFWVICKMSDMTESEGLRTVSPMSCAMGVGALVFTVLGAWLFPLS